MITSSDVQQRNKEIVLDMIDRVFHKRDPKVLDDHPGLSETVNLMERRSAAFPDLTVRVAETLAEGDRVACLVYVKGTHLGPFAGVPATGRTIEYSAISVDRLEDGRIVEHHANPDFYAILTQMGALPNLR